MLIKKYKGIFGEDDAEIIRHIVTNWLLEKSITNEERKKWKTLKHSRKIEKQHMISLIKISLKKML